MGLFLPLIVGFTGTRHGMTEAQKAAVEEKLTHLICGDHGHSCEMRVVVHHGDCVGADADFHRIARRLGFPVVIHPPDVGALRAHCEKFPDSELPTVLEPLPYLDRNQVIVAIARIVIATPAEMTEQVRSGTWSTIRRARRNGEAVTHVFLPDGRLMARELHS